MKSANIVIENYVAEQIQKYKGVSMPLKAGMFERTFKRSLRWNRMHPNPADEFCFPDIGPSHRIISEYEKHFRKAMKEGHPLFDEPIMVEKMAPDGYLILNGHHRWAAAMRCGIKKIPVKIVNLTQETDIRKILQNSTHDKRASFDLDEIVFGSADEKLLMKPLPFPRGMYYRERIRVGIPSIFHFLSVNGYDIWLYTSSYYSYDYIKQLLKCYHVHADGIITGTKRKVEATAENKAKNERLQNMIRDSYKETLHIDHSGVVRSFGSEKDFEQFDLNCSPSDWPSEVMTVLEKIVKKGKK
ncbi:MAG: ParB/RepB/Spo0J family partition protein [Lachnospiraceae bacterium]|nr:ParB/RepB/Spo0J family partition protein [Lachnospiraceae bacterium]